MFNKYVPKQHTEESVDNFHFLQNHLSDEEFQNYLLGKFFQNVLTSEQSFVKTASARFYLDNLIKQRLDDAKI